MEDPLEGATLRRASTFRVPPIMLDRSSGEPLHVQLYARMAEAIRSGELPPDARLPSTRTMASLLAVSRNTVLTTYEALAADDFIRAEPGSGTRVNGGSVVAGLRAVGLRRVIREARYPAHVLAITDPDGNAIHLNF